MAFSIFFSITVVMYISYGVSKKNVHHFEMIFIWMVVNIIHHNFMTIFALNMGMFDFGDHPTHYWTMALMRVFLIPVLIIWYMDRSLEGGHQYKNVMIIDGEIAEVGSSNYDLRSYRLNYEVCAVMYHCDVARELTEQFERDLAEATPYRLEDHMHRTSSERMLDQAARLLSPLL